MSEYEPPGQGVCCNAASSCVFATALLARAAVCECSVRRSAGERALVDCNSPVAHGQCSTLAALLHERARFALRLPSPGRPMIHALALRLQCGGLLGIQRSLATPRADVHRMVVAAHERHGSLTELPWDAIVQSIKAWQPHRARRTTPP